MSIISSGGGGALELGFSKGVGMELGMERREMVQRLDEGLWQVRGSGMVVDGFGGYGAVASRCGSSWGSLGEGG